MSRGRERQTSSFRCRAAVRRIRRARCPPSTRSLPSGLARTRPTRVPRGARQRASSAPPRARTPCSLARRAHSSTASLERGAINLRRVGVVRSSRHATARASRRSRGFIPTCRARIRRPARCASCIRSATRRQRRDRSAPWSCIASSNARRRSRAVRASGVSAARCRYRLPPPPRPPGARSARRAP